MNKVLEQLQNTIVEFDLDNVADVMNKTILAIPDPLQILNQALLPAMNIVGQRFNDQEYFLPELLAAATAMNQAMEILKPHLQKVPSSGPKCKIVIGSVWGDMHDIGKNIVKILLQAANVEVIDLGKNVPPEKFVQTIQEHNPQFLGLSALLTTTMLEMKSVIQALVQANLRSKVKILIGGAPVTAEYAQEIHADYYCAQALDAVKIVQDALEK